MTDVAIGAPFEDNGAVYVYHGSADGINPTYKQVRVLLTPVWSAKAAAVSAWVHEAQIKTSRTSSLEV